MDNHENQQNAVQLTETSVVAKSLVNRGLLKEADDLLGHAIGRKSANVIDMVEWVRISSTQGHHRKAIERLQVAKGAFANLNWTRFEAQTLLHARCFDHVTTQLQNQIQQRRDVEWSRQTLAYVNRLRDIDKWFSERPLQPVDYIAYCINLDEQDQKWQRCQLEAAATNLELVRIPGVRGSYLPNSVLRRLGEGINDKFKGTAGCFLSHLRAWECFLEANNEYALIVEDDFRPLLRFPNALASMNIPDGFDVCWINRRMDMPGARQRMFRSVQDVVKKRAARRWLACGTEGYVLSRSGAKKLIAYVSEDGLYGDVDWRLLTYSLQPDEILSLNEQYHARKAMEMHLNIIRNRTPLTSFSASTGFIGLADTGSARRLQNSGRHVHELI